MERANEEKNKKSKINRVISYALILVSFVLLVFCIHQVITYITLANENSRLTRDLASLKQDSSYLRDNSEFDVLKNENYYSVYIDSNYQFVDGREDSVSLIK